MPASPPSGSQQETPLRVIVFPGVQNLPIYAAQAKKFFAERGLRVDVQFTPNSQVMREGLAKAGSCYDIFADPAGGFAPDARLDLEGFTNVLKLRAELEGQWGGTPPSPEKYLDLSYYDRALAGV